MSQNLIKRWYHLTSPHFLVVLSRVRIKKSLLVSFVSGSMITKFDVAKSSSYPHYPVGRYYHGIPPDLWVRMNVSRFHLSQEAWIIWCRKIFLFTPFSCCTILPNLINLMLQNLPFPPIILLDTIITRYRLIIE